MKVSNIWLRAQRLWMIDNGLGNVIEIIRRKAFHFSDLRALSFIPNDCREYIVESATFVDDRQLLWKCCCNHSSEDVSIFRPTSSFKVAKCILVLGLELENQLGRFFVSQRPPRRMLCSPLVRANADYSYVLCCRTARPCSPKLCLFQA